ncbi:type II secretion system protein [Janthinobacterium sp.]|uniref:pilus assembly FimT family protein n=1 Tax=Janthinobacterium sp. TaxID=1871054 RepID=UPI00293D379B|nr:type II secretion system protein [Janthinobacterium sp.]
MGQDACKPAAGPMTVLPFRIPAQAGFTLVELIAVMIIAGILAAFAMPRFFERKLFDARNYADQSKAMLRYAQKIAIAQNRSVFVRLDGQSVALCFNYQSDPACSSGNRVRPPSGGNSASGTTLAACSGASDWNCEGLPAGVSYARAPAYTSFYFSALGRPYASTDADGVLVSTFATTVLTVSGGGSDYPITVEAETGYVH